MSVNQLLLGDNLETLRSIDSESAIKLVQMEEIVTTAKKPTLRVDLTDVGKDSKGLHTISFHATGESAIGVEFYSWDFNYCDNVFKAEVLLDKVGQ